MDFEHIQRQWRLLDEKLERTLKLQAELLRQTTIEPARRRVTRLALWPTIDVGLAIATYLVVLSVLREYGLDWRLVVPSGGLLAAAVALAASGVRQLSLVGRIDWSGPVGEIQRCLEELRLAKIRQFKWVILLAPLVSFCALVVVGQWLAGRLSDGQFHLVDRLHGPWVAANYAFGLAFVPAGYAVARLLAHRMRARRSWQRLLDDVAGTSLVAARKQLLQWQEMAGERARK